MRVLNQIVVSATYTDAATIQDVYRSSGGSWVLIGSGACYAQLQSNVRGQSQWTNEFPAPTSGIIQPGTTGIRFRLVTAGSNATVNATLSDPAEPAVYLSSAGQIPSTTGLVNVAVDSVSIGVEPGIDLVNGSDVAIVGTDVPARSWIQASFYLYKYNFLKYGADPTGVGDSYSAIQSCLNDAGTAGAGIVFTGGEQANYRVTSELTMPYNGVRLLGGGIWGHLTTNTTSPTRIIADHSAGSVMRVSGEGTTIEYVEFAASASRTAGAAGANYGVRVEAPDVANARCQRTWLRRIRVTGQPNHGLLMLSDCVCSQLDLVDVDNCAGHGIVIDSGQILGRTNTIRPGQIDLYNCRSTRLGGHSLLVGNPAKDTGTDIPYRIGVHNFESFQVAADPAVYLQPYNMLLFGENIDTYRCGISGSNAAGTTPIIAGMWVAGRYHQHHNHRYISCATHIMHVDSTTNLGTREIFVIGGDVENVFQGAGYFNPAIDVVGAAVHNLTVAMHCTNNVIGTLVPFTSTNYNIQQFGNWWRNGLPSADPTKVGELYTNGVPSAGNPKAIFISGG